MKKRNAFLLMVLSSLLLTGCGGQSEEETNSSVPSSHEQPSTSELSEEERLFQTWLESPDSKDYDLDQEITIKDYEIYKDYKKWMSSIEVEDLNGDGEINYDDYTNYLVYEKWAISEEAIDYNKDDSIDLKDYIIHLAYTKWNQSEESFDYDENTIINYDDYKIYLNYQEWLSSKYVYDFDGDGSNTYLDYKESLKEENKDFINWYLSLDSRDINGDEKVDKLDYNYVLLSAQYYIYNYKYKGKFNLIINDCGLDLSKLIFYLDDTTITFNEDKLSIELSKKLKDKLGTKNVESFTKTIEEATLLVDDASTFSIAINLEIDGENKLFTLKFNKNKNTNMFDTTIETLVKNYKVEISFSLKKVTK